jgi:hypothetical protein
VDFLHIHAKNPDYPVCMTPDENNPAIRGAFKYERALFFNRAGKGPVRRTALYIRAFNVPPVRPCAAAAGKGPGQGS